MNDIPSLLLTPYQRAQLAHLRACIQEKKNLKIPVDEKEPLSSTVENTSKKTRLLKQLRLARKLRENLESSAAEAESFQEKLPVNLARIEARRLLADRSTDISSLVALTEAVRNGYTLGSYHYYEKVCEREISRERGELEDARKTIQGHFDRLHELFNTRNDIKPQEDKADNKDNLERTPSKDIGAVKSISSLSKVIDSNESRDSEDEFNANPESKKQTPPEIVKKETNTKGYPSKKIKLQMPLHDGLSSRKVAPSAASSSPKDDCQGIDEADKDRTRVSKGLRSFRESVLHHRQLVEKQLNRTVALQRAAEEASNPKRAVQVDRAKREDDMSESSGNGVPSRESTAAAMRSKESKPLLKRPAESDYPKND